MENAILTPETTTTPAVATKPEVVKAPKPVISSATLKLPKGVEMKICKTCTIFNIGTRKAALKGHLLELTNPTKEMGDRVEMFTNAQIEKCHLGAMRGSISPVKDNADLEKILGKYFKGASAAKPVATPAAPKAKKTAKAKVIVPAPVAEIAAPAAPSTEVAVA